MSIRDVEFIFVSTICRFDFEFTRQYGIFFIICFSNVDHCLHVIFFEHHVHYFTFKCWFLQEYRSVFFSMATLFNQLYESVDILLTFKQLRDCIISLIWFSLKTSFTPSLNWFACAKLREWMVMYICVVEISIFFCFYEFWNCSKYSKHKHDSHNLVKTNHGFPLVNSDNIQNTFSVFRIQ